MTDKYENKHGLIFEGVIKASTNLKSVTEACLKLFELDVNTDRLPKDRIREALYQFSYLLLSFNLNIPLTLYSEHMNTTFHLALVVLSNEPPFSVGESRFVIGEPLEFWLDKKESAVVNTFSRSILSIFCANGLARYVNGPFTSTEKGKELIQIIKEINHCADIIGKYKTSNEEIITKLKELRSKYYD